MKIHTLRHWLFYAGVIVVVGLSIGAARSILDWSYGLTFVVTAVAATISATMAIREDWSAPPRDRRHQPRRRA